MKHLLIVGAGKKGTAFLRMMLETRNTANVTIVDINPDAPGVHLAQSRGIATHTDWRSVLSDDIDVVVEATGEETTFRQIRNRRSRHTVMIPGTVANLVAGLMEDKEDLIAQLKSQSYQQELILNLTQDAMIAIDMDEKITLFNKSAERMTGFKRAEVIGKTISNVMPSTKLPRVLSTGQSEVNQEQMLENGLKIITTRIAMVDHDDKQFGAFAVFKDITEIENLAEEVTNLKSIQTMLKAIIHSSEEAISVVDGGGKGLMINPAYTKLTGLDAEDVIGKPATADISEGESMHMKVLKTGKAVRGVRMKVGPTKRDVIVNAAPVIVDGKIKGSVGLIHDMSEITSLTDELQRARRIIRTLEAKYSFDDIIGSTSEEMNLVIGQAKLAASTPATILLRGESGTGKELFAHAIHNASERRFKRFVRVNGAAISESLLESELFGYEEGAFSGAKRGGKRGLFEEANGGSIFLDEIGELSPNTQAKLLRVLQENEIIRVGGTKPVSINVRVIAATNVHLENRIMNGQFRDDLYYRLNRMPLYIPPLRQRKEDLNFLCDYLITKLNQDYGRNVEGLTDAALQYLKEYHWPGNVRELENILGRAMIHMNFHESKIDVEDIPPLEIRQLTFDNHEIRQNYRSGQTLAEQIQAFEKGILVEALKEHHGNKTKTARALNISLRNLYYKMEKYQLA